MKKSKVKKQVVKRMMERARIIDRNCPEQCRDFTIYTSIEHPDTLILGWCTIDIGNPDRPVQCYRYECFDTDGTPLNCSIHYSNQQEANRFFERLKPMYHQEYSTTP